MVFIALLALCVPVMAHTYFVPQATSTPAIDGTMSAGEWDDSVLIEMKYPEVTQSPQDGVLLYGETPLPALLSANVYAKWDSDYLYLAYRVFDNDKNWLTFYGAAHNAQDATQLCWNLGNDPNAIYRVEAIIFDFVAQTKDSLGPDIYDDRSNQSTDLLPNALIDADANLADGYLIELALLWSDFNYNAGYVPQVGDQHGAGLMLVDYDAGFIYDVMADFSDEGAFGSSAVYAYHTWTLVSADGCGKWGILPTDYDRDCDVNLTDFSQFAADWMTCTDPNDLSCVKLN